MGQKKAGKGQWQDHYTRQAKKEDYPARSVFKLKEIQKKFAIIQTGDRVLDLGCAPGSWLKYAAELVSPSGHVVGIDLKPVTLDLPDHATAICGDIYDVTLPDDSYHVVMSDMAPDTTGHKATDVARSEALCEMALYVADRHLKPGGNFVCKIFQGSGFDAFLKSMRLRFATVKQFKPDSCRKASKEIFIIGMGKQEDDTNGRP